MVDLVLRPSGLPESAGKPWSLQLRYHDCCGPADYHTLLRVSDEVAQEIIKAGAPEWLFGEPDWNERSRLKRIECARQMEERAAELRAE